MREQDHHECHQHPSAPPNSALAPPAVFFRKSTPSTTCPPRSTRGSMSLSRSRSDFVMRPDRFWALVEALPPFPLDCSCAAPQWERAMTLPELFGPPRMFGVASAQLSGCQLIWLCRGTRLRLDWGDHPCLVMPATACNNCAQTRAGARGRGRQHRTHPGVPRGRR